MSAGRTVSIRVPEGLPEELRAATGLQFSTLVRTVMSAYLERLRAERRLAEGRANQQRVTEELTLLVNEEMDKGATT